MPAYIIFSVILRSDMLILRSDEGWLCSIIIAAAFDKIADLYNSLPVTKEVLTLPILTTLKLMGRPFPSRLTTQTSSRSSSANTGAKTETAFSGISITSLLNTLSLSVSFNRTSTCFNS